MRQKIVEKAVDGIIEKLKEIRLDQGVSHESLAKKTGLNRSAISLIESRKRQPTLLNCIKIATALNVKLEDIMRDMEIKDD